ncbi:cation:proton antiporter family protein [Persicobacter diffluens]|uniref:Potassium transporter Kef n=1 Tax=Persicobacter diffluens TaxID=981 RepID=A0AAN5AM44_9BACT|nr:potassium transporter Kef [Persicobacter diffluens]
MENIILIFTTFTAGLLSFKSKFPPLVGFLIAGFILHALGFESNEYIQWMADTGVTILLFSIGLKLDIKMLVGKQIWLSALLHNLGSTLYFFLALYALQFFGLPILSGMQYHQLALIAFALSFSSTVFAIKALQEKGGMNAIYGMLAIGVLVMQDIFAVIFMTISSGKMPEIWALSLFVLPLIRPLLYKIMDMVGHGELLVLYGIFLTFVLGAGLFQYVGLKPDLGALILGILMAEHQKASELSKSLFNLKELLLVCFFLQIGLSTALSLSAIILAFLFILLQPIKTVLYYTLFDLFKFRKRTSIYAAITLTNYSEFGLIVGGLGLKLGWLPAEILVAIALAVSISFLFAAPLNQYNDTIYLTIKNFLKEGELFNQMERPISIGNPETLIVGMGRIGTGIYEEMSQNQTVAGIEINENSIERHKRKGRKVHLGDAVSQDFWQRLENLNQIGTVLLAMPHHDANTQATIQLRKIGYTGKIAAIVEYEDQIESLQKEGANAVFNVYREAGKGFAHHVKEQFGALKS